MADDPFDALLDRIYDAALDPKRWETALQSLCDATGNGTAAALLLQDRSSAEVGLIKFVGHSPEAIAAYRDHYSKLNPWFEPTCRRPTGEILAGHELVDQDAFVTGEFYNEWLRPQGLYDIVGCIVGRSPTTIASINILLPEAAGLCTDRERNFARRVAPHVRRAVDIHRRLFAAQALRDGLARGLDRLGVGVLLIGSGCRVLFANRLGETILERGDGLTCSHGRLRAATQQANAELDRRICAAVATGLRRGEDAGGVAVVPTARGRPIVVLVCPCRGDLGYGEVDPAAILSVSDPESEARVDEHQVARIYGLTRAEARLFGALLKGKRLAEYAEESAITLNTAKGYLKQLLSKTGASRQADLMRLALSDPVLRMAMPDSPVML